MRKYVLALAIGTGLVLSGCGGGDDTDTTAPSENNNAATEAPATTASGEELYKQSCASCHGQNLEGRGNAPALATVGSTYSAEEIQNIILNGKGTMPPGILQGEDAAAVAAWLAEQK